MLSQHLLSKQHESQARMAAGSLRLVLPRPGLPEDQQAASSPAPAAHMSCLVWGLSQGGYSSPAWPGLALPLPCCLNTQGMEPGWKRLGSIDEGWDPTMDILFDYLGEIFHLLVHSPKCLQGPSLRKPGAEARSQLPEIPSGSLTWEAVTT